MGREEEEGDKEDEAKEGVIKVGSHRLGPL